MSPLMLRERSRVELAGCYLRERINAARFEKAGIFVKTQDDSTLSIIIMKKAA